MKKRLRFLVVLSLASFLPPLAAQPNVRGAPVDAPTNNAFVPMALNLSQRTALEQRLNLSSNQLVCVRQELRKFAEL